MCFHQTSEKRKTNFFIVSTEVSRNYLEIRLFSSLLIISFNWALTLINLKKEKKLHLKFDSFYNSN